MQWANPCALILNIEEVTDHSCLENCSGAKCKVFTLYCYSSKTLITKPVAPLSTASFTVHSDYSYAHIYQLNEDFVVIEIHHGHFQFFVRRFLKFFGSNVVPVVYSWRTRYQSLKTWKINNYFPCLKIFWKSSARKPIQKKPVLIF